MKQTLLCLLMGQALASLAIADDNGFSTLPKKIQSKLIGGMAVVLDRRPDESSKTDGRFVTVAKLITGSRAEIWNVINDKEGAEHFLDGVLASKVIEENEGYLIVEQETHVGGPKGSYKYTLRHDFTGMERADFKFIKGEIKNIEGAWWLFDCPVEDKHLVVYTLHIDPGVFAPQIIVKSGMKKTMPETFKSVQREVLRRRKVVAAAKR